jgi:hypothetical protein
MMQVQLFNTFVTTMSDKAPTHDPKGTRPQETKPQPEKVTNGGNSSASYQVSTKDLKPLNIKPGNSTPRS